VYSVTLEACKAKRQAILDRLIAEARGRAEESGRSLNCNERRRWRGPDHQPVSAALSAAYVSATIRYQQWPSHIEVLHLRQCGS
jgi:hypothetical protein